MRSRPFITCLFLSVASFAITAWARADSAKRISEFLAINSSGIEDEDGDNSDRIEIYNISASAINTENWSLSDDSDAPDKWKLLSRILQPDDRLEIFASDKDHLPH